jgi:cell division septation protein DedD
VPTIQTPPPPAGYVVQVSSQRTEAEAQAAWQNLQARYSSVLAGRQATIRRADLGDRGTFYRAQVGPFSSRDDASRFRNLKSAGGGVVSA